MKLILISKGAVFIQCQFVIIVSVPWSRKIISGSRLIKNAAFTEVLTCVIAHF